MKKTTGIISFVGVLATALFAVMDDQEVGSFIPPKPRLQMDIGVNSPEMRWWHEAHETVDERIAWWREARFGMFIHWNASSLLGGVWKDQVYNGYSEHIQRKATITQDEYLHEVIKKFNPVHFDANEWARAAYAAGMRYMIITAKHHDGFAMWDSDVSEYNIVEKTLFKRDPMKELKEACDKYGLKFGFYYSHAFDWGEPDGVGNDWEWENPGGGKKLHGGEMWYDEHPELVPKFRNYVDRKAIPQCLELILKYDPDILWFDTPPKLPPEENIRVLRAVREAKPDILINSRVVAYAPGWDHMGDYLSTGDRAVDFPATPGDWEAIPTTNESYGYHRMDRSHKTPEFLIRLIAKAAAQGGNTLLNIGPRGDGTMDEADLDILAGIGKWMDVNSASIRRTQRSTLPTQAWGESTREGNTLYLHVFDWPSDGQLEFGSFTGNVKKAWLLSDRSKTALPHERIDELTVCLEVPKQAPDKGSSVIVVETNDAESTTNHRLLSLKQKNILRAFNGIPTGPALTYGDGKAINNGVSGWKDSNQKITWPVYLTADGTYTVSAEYKPLGNTSQQYRLKIGNTELICHTETRNETNGKQRPFITQKLGNVKIKRGQIVIEFSPLDEPVNGLMVLRALHFTPNTNLMQRNSEG